MPKEDGAGSTSPTFMHQKVFTNTVLRSGGVSHLIVYKSQPVRRNGKDRVIGSSCYQHKDIQRIEDKEMAWCNPQCCTFLLFVWQTAMTVEAKLKGHAESSGKEVPPPAREKGENSC